MHRVATFTDGNGNVSRYCYDGQDRLSALIYPTPSSVSCTSPGSDYEGYAYDAAGNLTSHRNRTAANTFAMTYDDLNRLIAIDAPSGSPDVAWTYDLLGRTLTSAQTGTPTQTLTYTWDALGRMTSETQALGTMAYQYDLAGRMTRITWPDSFDVDYTWNLYGEMLQVREDGATSGPGLLAVYGWDDRGRRTGVTYGNGVSTAYGYDAVSRLTSLSNNLTGSTNDVAFTYAYNPAGQIVERVSDNRTGHTPFSPISGCSLQGTMRVNRAPRTFCSHTTTH